MTISLGAGRWEKSSRKQDLTILSCDELVLWSQKVFLMKLRKEGCLNYLRVLSSHGH